MQSVSPVTRRIVETEFGPIEIPGTLYKYRSLAGEQRAFTRDIVCNRELWWSPASQLNDALDCNPLARLEGSALAKELAMRRSLRTSAPTIPKREVKRLAKMWAKRPPSEFESAMGQLIERGRATIGVCSLSATPVSEKMWSDYADKHRGICLQFDDFTREGRELSADPHFGLAMRVTYEDQRPEIPVYGGDAGFEKLKRYLLTKTLKWEYEEEWRLVDQAFTGNRAFPPKCLTGIILGKDIALSDRGEVLNWISSRPEPMELLQVVGADVLKIITADKPIHRADMVHNDEIGHSSRESRRQKSPRQS